MSYFLLNVTSFTLLQGRTIWAIFDCLLADSQWCSSMPFLTARDFHWDQQTLYVGLRSAMSFHSECYLVSTSSRMGPMSWLFSCSLLRAAIACTCLTSAHASTLWQWIHTFRQGCQGRASASFFGLDGAWEWSFTFVSAESSGWFVP
jgi:hypothetical protein